MAAIPLRVEESEEIDAEAQLNRDPSAFDNLLAEEMNNLSFRDRNDLQEEIHGVRCLAIEETPELVKKALSQLAYEIDKRTPDSQKTAYLISQQQTKEIPEQQRILQELHALEPLPQHTYVNDDEFRLRFLRCELFDIKKSAARMLCFLDLVLELFGEYALRRPIRLSDFSKEEMQQWRKGRYQLMPNRDRSGRRCSVLFPEDPNDRSLPHVRAKIMMYISWSMGHQDIETQRKGHVLVVWEDRNFPLKTGIQKEKYQYGALKSTRVSAIHICTPDTPYYQIRRGIILMRAGDEYRKKLKLHLGESVELQYALQGYGVPAEDIPISWTGKVKMKYLVQWMRIRHAVETDDLGSTRIVECPEPKDVLFRKGNNYTSHPGNVKLRNMIVDKACYRDGTDILKRPKQLSHEIFDARLKILKEESMEEHNYSDEKLGRYLLWDNKKDWWIKMTDKQQICLKLEYIIRELRKSHGIGSKLIARAKKRGSLNLRSDTTVFQAQDGTNHGGCKKQRLNHKGIFEAYDNNHSGSSDEENHHSDRCTTQCFGMKFAPCSISYE